MARLITKNNTTAGALPATAALDVGELGVNVADRKLYTKHGTDIVRIDGAYVDSVAPTSGAVEGDLWYDTANNMLKTYNGTSWVAAGYTTLSQFGITATAAELNHTDGVTSNIQTQLNGKAASGHNHAGVYEPADATILKDADIGTNVQGYSAVLQNTTASFTTADESKLDGIEAGADVTDAANVSAAGALMESELTSLPSVKAIDQQLTTTSNVGFHSLILSGNLTVNGTYTTVHSNEVSIGDSVILLNADETGVPSQNAGFEVERGTSANVSFIWNEANDSWDMGGHNLDNVTIDGGTF